VKKTVIAFVAGALLMVSGQALAEELSKIGKKIEGEAKVILEGQELSNAIIVDGKSYAPVRDIVEAYGSTATYMKGVIKIEMAAGMTILQVKQRQIKADIEKLNKDIANLKDYVIPEEEKALAATTNKEIWRERVDRRKVELKEKEAELENLNRQLEDIEKEIAELESAE
jgi:hypothetical protein